MMEFDDELYRLENVCKHYVGPAEDVIVLDKVNLSIRQGESLAIVGASGSGKSTLLHLLGGLDTASSGSILFKGRELCGLSPEELAKVRNTEIGFVFQFHHLLPEFSTLENVAMQALIGGVPQAKAFKMAEETLELVGLSHRIQHSVTTLSGGERQRAAIARAVLVKPKVLLADEPTGNLDQDTGNNIANLLLNLNKKTGMTLVLVTHNPELAALMNRRLEMKSRRLL